MPQDDSDHDGGQARQDRDDTKDRRQAPTLRPQAVEVDDAAAFILELVHADGVDGVYRVTFVDGTPVDACRED